MLKLIGLSSGLKRKRDTSGNVLLTHRAFQFRAQDQLQLIFVLAGIAEKIVFGFGPEIGLRRQGLAPVYPRHPSGSKTIPDAATIVQTSLKDTSAFESRRAAKIVRRSKQPDIAQPQLEPVRGLFDGGLIQMH